MAIIGAIPARWASTRFPGKVLADLNGKPMIQHVWEGVRACRRLDDVYIVCDAEHVARAAEGFGAKVIMTSPDLASGTDRLAAAFQDSSVDIILNIQGDEPLVSASAIDALAGVLADDPVPPMATVIRPLNDAGDVANPNVVKVVVDHQGYALYFSRAPIPYNRDGAEVTPGTYFKHLGLYAYRRDFLLKFKSLPASRLEAWEKLEQLRVLAAGYKIKTVVTEHDSIGVDTPADLEKVAAFLRKR